MTKHEIVYEHHHARHCEGRSPEAISTDNLCLIQRLLRYTRNDAFCLLSSVF
jgi:hypothetical protein